MKMNSFSTALIGLALLFVGCASAPSFPDPKPGQGQILVNLQGEAREGVEGPNRRTVEGEYSSSSESVEQGKAFERVDYDEIEDVVVFLRDVSAEFDASYDEPPTTYLYSSDEQAMAVEGEGFSRRCIGVSGAQEGKPAVVNLTNERSTPVTVFAFNEADDGFEQTINAGQTTGLRFFEEGSYELYCDELDEAFCVVHVYNSAFVWNGSSEETPFFDGLAEGGYIVLVKAPRLPPESITVGVYAGKRATVTAKLTVNDLPEVSE